MTEEEMIEDIYKEKVVQWLAEIYAWEMWRKALCDLADGDQEIAYREAEILYQERREIQMAKQKKKKKVKPKMKHKQKVKGGR